MQFHDVIFVYLVEALEKSIQLLQYFAAQSFDSVNAQTLRRSYASQSVFLEDECEQDTNEREMSTVKMGESLASYVT